MKKLWIPIVILALVAGLAYLGNAQVTGPYPIPSAIGKVKGDLPVYNGSKWVKQGKGTDGQYLKYNSGTATGLDVGDGAGPQGPTGPAGPKGDTGNPGAAGGTGAPGADGKTVLYGTAAPTTEGNNGDFYIRTTTNYIYGPKAGGSWPAGGSLVGPTGSTGATGDTGATGATGATREATAYAWWW